MLFEGTGLYFWLLFLIFLLVYITVKVCLGSLFKKMREKSWKAYIPFYSTYLLVKKLDLRITVFYMTLIPFVNLYYYNIIAKKMLEVFAQNTADSIWYVVFPMYKFPELVFKNPIYIEQNNYELTSQFIAAQDEIFNKPQEELPSEITLVDVNKMVEEQNDGSGLIINPANFQQDMDVTNNSNQMPISNSPVNDPNGIGMYINNSAPNVYENNITDDEKNKVTYVKAKETKKEEKKPIITPLDQGKERVCPKCGTRLASTATTCFMCGTILD